MRSQSFSFWGEKMRLKNSHSCNSCQSGDFPTQPSRGELRENHCWALKWKGEIHGISTGCVSHTHTDTFWISSPFFIPEKQLLQTWPGTGTQSIVLVTFMPHFTWVGIFLSLFFRLFFYLFIWSSVSGCCSRTMAFGQHPELCPQL